MATSNVYKKIDALADEMGTAASHRLEIEQEINDLTTELDALDQMAEDATDRTEYDKITDARKDAELDLKFAKNRLRRFNQSPRIDTETLDGLLSQLSAEVDSAAKTYRQKVEKPVAEVIKAGDEFDQTISKVREAMRKLHSVQGPMIERDESTKRAFDRFELGKLRSRAYCDGTIVYPGLRDALKLASTAKWEPFDTH